MKKLLALALAAIMPFSNPIIGNNDTLIRNKMQSENFVAGVSGWRVTRAGDAEFNDIIARGSGVFGPVPGKHIEINTPGHLGEIAFFTGVGGETPSVLRPQDSASGVLYLETATEFDVYSPAIRIGTLGNALMIDTLNSRPIIRIDGEVWLNIPLVNSWVDLAGARANYFRDATGRVQLRGQIVSGTSTTIATLPAGYRPTQSMEWVMRGVGGVIMCAVQVSNAGVMTVTANAATAQGSGIKLDSISFPTF